jgi:predicted DNA-binding protein with PD1-like motif
MRAKLLNDRPDKTYALVFVTGDEVMKTLQAFAREKQLAGSRFTAIGAFREATLGYFDWEKKDYQRIPVREQVEVLSLIGDVAVDEQGEPKLHAHVVVGKSDGTAHGGHLLEAVVRPTLEVVLVESPRHLQRRHDPETGLALIRV